MATCAWCGAGVTVRQVVVGKPGLFVLHRQCVAGWVEHEEAKMGEQAQDKPDKDKPDKPEHPHGTPPGQDPDFVPPGQGGVPPGQDKPRPEHPIVEPDEEEDDAAQPKE